MRRTRYCFLIGVGLLSLVMEGRLTGAEMTWKAGVSRAIITPSEPLWMAGYASRDRPAEGKVMDLWIKVLALEDAQGNQALILTSDTLGIPRSIARAVTSAMEKEFKLEARQVMLAASHTHCGPVLRGALYDAYPLEELERAKIDQYSSQLERRIVAAAGQALADLKPARVAAGQGKTGFAVNRRTNPEASVPQLIQDGTLKGPVDHAVPVLAVYELTGALRAVVFGYACHNTVMAFNQWSGDYAGYAQLALETSHPGSAAMFFMGCGGDQNPLPRRESFLAERYGRMLAAAVEEVLLAPPAALAPKLQTSLREIPLKFGPAPSREELQRFKTNNAPFIQRWAGRLLSELDAGKEFERTYPFPLQAWRLGEAQLWIALGGEPVVDYSLRLKERWGPQTWVAGYCNDVMTYIPSLRVLKEGGYEGGSSMMVYGLPTLRWAEDVEEVILENARQMVEQLLK